MSTPIVSLEPAATMYNCCLSTRMFNLSRRFFGGTTREKIKEWIGGLDLPITGPSAETLFYDEVYPQHKPYGAEIGAMLGQGGVWAHELRSEAVQLQSRGQRGNRTCCTIRPLKVDMQGSFIQVYKKYIHGRAVVSKTACRKKPLLYILG